MSLALEVDPGEPSPGSVLCAGAFVGERGERCPSGVGGPADDGGRGLFDPELRLSSELGYATPTPVRRGTLTTYGAFSSAGGASRQYRVGRRLELGILSMSLEAERRESADAASEHRIRLTGSIRF